MPERCYKCFSTKVAYVLPKNFKRFPGACRGVSAILECQACGHWLSAIATKVLIRRWGKNLKQATNAVESALQVDFS